MKIEDWSGIGNKKAGDNNKVVYNWSNYSESLVRREIGNDESKVRENNERKGRKPRKDGKKGNKRSLDKLWESEERGKNGKWKKSVIIYSLATH